MGVGGRGSDKSVNQESVFDLFATSSGIGLFAIHPDRVTYAYGGGYSIMEKLGKFICGNGAGVVKNTVDTYVPYSLTRGCEDVCVCVWNSGLFLYAIRQFCTEIILCCVLPPLLCSISSHMKPLHSIASATDPIHRVRPKLVANIHSFSSSRVYSCSYFFYISIFYRMMRQDSSSSSGLLLVIL